MQKSLIENQRILDLIGDNAELALKFKEFTSKLYYYFVEDFSRKYNQELFKGFMEVALKEFFRNNKERILSYDFNSEATEFLKTEKFKGGSAFLSVLIDKYLTKLEKNGDFNEKHLQNLRELISARNNLQREEARFLDESYRRYLLELYGKIKK